MVHIMMKEQPFTDDHKSSSLTFKTFTSLQAIAPLMSQEKSHKRVHFSRNDCIFKACVRYFLSNFDFSLNDSPSKSMKNVFYFI